MKTYNNASSHEKPKSKELNHNTLYIRSNIKKEFDENLNKDVYIYDEIQLLGNEIIDYLEQKQTENEQLVTDLELNQLQTEQTLTDLELKILDMEGKENDTE